MNDQTDGTAADRDCPPWCRGSHAETLHPDDRHHTSPPRRVALVTGRPTLESDDHAVATAVIARLVRRDRAGSTWLEVVSEEGRDLRLVATTDSAARLLAVLEDLLAAAEQ